MSPFLVLASIAVGYLFGSISFARLMIRLMAPGSDLGDLEVSLDGEQEGEPVGIYGANAASMILGPKRGCLVAILDISKVAVPVLAARLLFPDQVYHLIVSVAGLVGHNWPLYYRFKGGRGFSVMIGSYLVIDWLGALLTPLIGLLFGMIVLRNLMASYVLWVYLMVPWFWIRTRDPAYVAYAIAINVIFTIATVPEMRTMLKYRREGRLDEYIAALTTSSPRWRGMKRMYERLDFFSKRPAGKGRE